MTRKIRTTLFLLIFSIGTFAQPVNIRIDAKDKPLNEILVSLRDQYNYQFSYNDNQLSKYKITVSKTFQKKEEAIQFLLKGLPFELKKSGEVMIIVPLKEAKVKEEPPTEKKKMAAKIAGQILEAESLEPLPFSSVTINNKSLVTDMMGNFAYTASSDSSFHVQVSHLGYYVYDTILHSGTKHQLTLFPSSEKIEEITVRGNPIEKATLVGERPGKIKLNHTISRFIPGQGDNSVFNLIRLMPGILASGELSTDLLVWGSYEGQSQITFDGFTLFGLKNYNDNISAVNPLVVKDIEIYKGGFDAKYGNRVGGLINISGKNGSLQKPTFTFNANQTTLNGMAEIPLFKCSSLLVAYRQTYYNLYDSTDFNIFAPISSSSKKKKSISNLFDFNTYPDLYSFRDLNLKYTYHFNQGNLLSVSLYGGRDKFDLATDAEITRKVTSKSEGKQNTIFQVTIHDNEINRQRGGSLFYGKKWINGNTSTLSITHSRYIKTTSDELETENRRTGNITQRFNAAFENEAFENSLKNDNTFILANNHQVEGGAGICMNKTSVVNTIQGLRDSILIDTTSTFQNSRTYFYLQDQIQAMQNLELRAGMRLNYQLAVRKFFPEPRLSATYKISKIIKANVSWGLYNQFMYKIGNVDKDQNYTFLWVTSNNNIPVLKASHTTAGVNIFSNGFTMNAECYYKKTRNLTRRIYATTLSDSRYQNEYRTYKGDARALGFDLFLKKDIGKHAVWASYSLGKVMERLALPGKTLPEYTPAPHDQRHEFKIAGLYNFRKFYFSANYVYGSGMQILKDVFDEEEDVHYSRFDIATTYHFNPWGKTAEIGFSILNLFDTQNLKYANLKRIQISEEIGSISVYSDAVPFTPTLFLRIVL
ncbi:MAG TPA: TonB-dependent receptor plug domain-containing protein [Prolixibacteraceae bacterium]|nr:TonB-dependent receptor plug domain-containing protein [Prolixibacteraceae bacterium]HPS11653.1 TonB-dependent receptor plug domain-containing protein [Prolixibacteraceae bacterium]